MNSDWQLHRRFDPPHEPQPDLVCGWNDEPDDPERTESDSQASPLCDAQGNPVELADVIRRAREHLLSLQQPDGHWCGELEGDTILESEYILILAWLGRESCGRARRAAVRILQQQLPEGGWALYPGGPLEISASVKAYWALKLTGHDPHSEPMLRARQAILAAGGAEKVNSFTRYYMALLGIITYAQCPAVPPELVLLPSWGPLSIYDFSAWSRTIIVPLSLLWAFRPVRPLPDSGRIDELFVKTPGELPSTMAPAEHLDPLRRRSWIDWGWLFRQIDRGWKLIERLHLLPFRRWAIRRAADWIVQRLEHSDGLGAIFPPILWTLVALRCLGHSEDSELFQGQMRELERLVIDEDGAVRLQPCKSPVWDTALSTIALRDAGLPADSEPIRRSVRWLLAKEVRHPGDWSKRNPRTEPAGWFFEYENRFYPDVDDTIMVLMALQRSLPSTPLVTEWLWARSPLPSLEGTAVLSGQAASHGEAVVRIEQVRPAVEAMQRAIHWLLAMQNRDGGWGAFDRDNDREILTRIPFADHNAMIDPSTPDITARVLECLGRLGISRHHPAVERALQFLWSTQEDDGCWFGRWGVNYLYGTWQVLAGLAEIGVPRDDPRIQRAADWLEQAQQIHGGWGETPRSYDEPQLRGQGPATASQTAWALLGLAAAGRADGPAVERGLRYLAETQQADGNWDEPWWTGTGFPRVFYLKYHFYRLYFPLMALSRVARLRGMPPDLPRHTPR